MSSAVPSRPSPARSGNRTAPIVLVASLLGALGLTAWSDTHAEAQNHDPSHHARLVQAPPTAELRVLDWTLWNISKHYVDPGRIDPKTMLMGALEAFEGDIAEVLVEPLGDDRVRVRVGTAEQDFAVNDVEALWGVGPRVREVFGFITRSVPLTEQEQQDAEYAAVAGVLATLDPHTNLLRPADFADMKASTKGSFGGLGIEVGVREGAITVIRVIDGNPASKVDMQPGDRIVQIEAESTVTMNINDAVGLLRGPPGTTVTVYVMRAGLDRPKKLTITRATIQLDSVIGDVISETDDSGRTRKVGVVAIPRNFAETTGLELRKKLDGFREAGVEGVVLDLRGNPGGLLAAAVDVANAFLSSGTIVSTVGMASPREESQADDRYDFPDLPVVVIIDQESASASEIVAGALRNLGRAVVIGRRSFGKGSVQQLHDRRVGDKELALKLTIAQYLTPGDVSIQSVGVPPDLETIPVWIGREHVAYFGRTRFDLLREESLSQHLVSDAVRTDKTAFGPLYFLDRGSVGTKGEGDVADPEGDSNELDEDLPKDKHEAPSRSNKAKPKKPGRARPTADKLDRTAILLEDPEIRIARDLVLNAPSSRREDILANLPSFIAKEADLEQSKIAKSLAVRGIDWSPGPDQPSGTPKLRAQVRSDRPNNTIKGGEHGLVTVDVTNEGDVTAWQVRGITDSDYRYFDERELLFGRIDPGQTRSYSVKLTVAEHELSRTDRIDVHVFAGRNGQVVPASQASIDISAQGLPRPQFALAYQLLDAGHEPEHHGNGDGALQVGERPRLRVFVKNVGEGPALDPWVTLRNLAGDSVFLHSGREHLPVLKPGDVHSVDLDFEVTKPAEIGAKLLQLSVTDNKMAEFVSESLSYDLAAPGVSTAPERGGATATGPIDLYASPLRPARVVARAPAGARFAISGTAPGWVRLNLGDDSFAFAKADAVDTEAKAPDKPGEFTRVFDISPPRIVLRDTPNHAQGASILLNADVQDENQLLDAYVTVFNPSRDLFGRGEKVFYQATNDPIQGHLAFSANVPLSPGNNLVEVHARQDDEIVAIKRMWVLRTDGLTEARAKRHAYKSKGDLPVDTLR